MTASPNIQQWQQLWRIWDAATLHMIPPGQHSDRPLQLRQPFVFYLGHLPAFCDARLAKVLQQPLTEPAHYADMFARGIDPDLDDPTQCHSHSPTPPQWPDVADILAYRDRVRARILQTYSSTQHSPTSTAQDASTSTSSTSSTSSDAQLMQCTDSPGAQCSGTDSAAAIQLAAATAAAQDAKAACMPSELQHVLWMSYEHEAMHLETLMYLLVQYAAVQPPPAALVPDSPSIAWHSSIAAAAAAAAGVDGPTSCRPSGSPGLPDAAAGSPAAQLLLPPLPPGAPVASSTNGQLLLRLPPAATWVKVAPCKVTQGFTLNPRLESAAHSSSAVSQHLLNDISGSSRDTQQLQLQPLLCGWDNECPSREVSVAGFQVQHRAVTVLEYLHFLAARLAEGLGPGPAAALGSGPGSSSMGSADACQPVPSAVYSCSSLSGRAQRSSAQGDPQVGCSAGGSFNCVKALQDSCFTSSPNSDNLCCDSSTTLPKVLAAACSSQHKVCADCCRVLQDLLQSPAARGLLPASLALHAAHATCRTQHTSTPACSSSSCSLSGRCSGICSLHSVLPAAATPQAASTPSTASTVSTHGASAHQQQARVTVLRVLQQQLAVKTVFGLTPISIAGCWPVYCSALQAEQYAAWCGGPGQHCRLPTEHELLAACQHNAEIRSGGAGAYAGNRDRSAGVLGRDGVSSSAVGEDSSHAGCAGLATSAEALEPGATKGASGWGVGPAAEAPAGDEIEGLAGDSVPEQDCRTISHGSSRTARSPAATVSVQNLATASSLQLATGFAVWHPLCVPLHPSGVAAAAAAEAAAASAGGEAAEQINKEQHGSGDISANSALEYSSAVEVSQLSQNGWEWTSTVFERHEGFQAHPLYPEYSEDFFGGKHVVLLGGSWATVDSIAARPTFRNFYQKGQQHVFAKFRLCLA